jgi:hypothetical protein
MAIKPLHQDLDEMVGKLGFTSEAARAQRSGGVHGGRQWLVGWKLLGRALKLHGKLKDIRQQIEKAIGDEPHRRRCSPRVAE